MGLNYIDTYEISERLRKEMLKLIWDMTLAPEQSPRSAIEEPEPKANNADDERI